MRPFAAPYIKEKAKMEEMERMMMRVLRLVVAFVVGVAVCALLTCLVGCRTVRYVSVPEYHTEYKVRTDSVLRHDSVWVHDSVAVRLMGDTVWRDRWHTETAYRYLYKTKTDTVVRTDSVRVPLPVERRLGWWEQRKVDYFVPVCCVCGGLFVSLWWVIRRRRIAAARGKSEDC